MTLIYSYCFQGKIVGVGDILISTSKHRDRDVLISLPSRPANFSYKDEDIQIVGTCQKMYIFDDNHYVMWANSFFHARLAIKELKRIHEEKGVTGLEHLYTSRPDLLNDQFSLIFVSTDGEGNGLIERHCVSHGKEGSVELDVAGTGEYFFVYEAAEEIKKIIIRESGAKLDDFTVLQPVITGIANSFRKEFTVGDDFFKFGYGGWYDFVKYNEGFRKVPYCLKMWQRRKSGEMLNLSSFTCFYAGPYLCVLRINGEDEDECQFLHVVRDILSEPTIRSRQHYLKKFQQPDMTVHILNDQVNNTYPIYFDSRVEMPKFDIDEAGDATMNYDVEEAKANLIALAEGDWAKFERP